MCNLKKQYEKYHSNKLEYLKEANALNKMAQIASTSRLRSVWEYAVRNKMNRLKLVIERELKTRHEFYDKGTIHGISPKLLPENDGSNPRQEC